VLLWVLDQSVAGPTSGLANRAASGDDPDLSLR